VAHNSHWLISLLLIYALILVLITFVLIILAGINPQLFKNQVLTHVACTQEAKLCPDGSYVSRSGPNCEFAPCPSANNPGQACIQVITPARNPKTGECRDFPTPCAVPMGWQKVENCAVLK